MNTLPYPAEWAKRRRARIAAAEEWPNAAYPIFVVQNRYRSSNGDSGRLWVAIAGALGEDDRTSGSEWYANRIVLVVEAIQGERDEAVAFWRDPPPYVATDDDPTRAVELLREKLDEVLPAGTASDLDQVPLWYLCPGDPRWKEEAPTS